MSTIKILSNITEIIPEKNYRIINIKLYFLLRRGEKSRAKSRRKFSTTSTAGPTPLRTSRHGTIVKDIYPRECRQWSIEHARIICSVPCRFTPTIFPGTYRWCSGLCKCSRCSATSCHSIQFTVFKSNLPFVCL